MPPAPLVPGADGAADGGRGAGPAPPSPSPTCVDELAWPTGVDVGLVETAGGVRSPIAGGRRRGRRSPPPSGPTWSCWWPTPGSARSTPSGWRWPPLAAWPVTVVLNRFDAGDDLHVRNLDWLAGVDGLDVVTDAEDLVSPIVGWPVA